MTVHAICFDLDGTLAMYDGWKGPTAIGNPIPKMLARVIRWIEAGREVRIMVKPDVISDDQVILLARQIAKKIGDTLDYPGQIKVNVIRESRAIEYAK